MDAIVVSELSALFGAKVRKQTALQSIGHASIRSPNLVLGVAFAPAQF